jgi:hypothetical protein
MTKQLLVSTVVAALLLAPSAVRADELPIEGESRPWTKTGTNPDGNALCKSDPCHPPLLICCL